MNVASLELCKELYELSGWRYTEKHYWNGQAGVVSKEAIKWGYENYKENCLPAYNLGHLLRNLLPEYGKITITNDFGHKQWWATDVIGHAIFTASTPEDALCKLAIELHKQGILTKGKAHE